MLARPPQLISEFLAREVITPLPAPVREFLTRTAIPDSFTEALADRLTGRAARAVLDELDRANFPVRQENRDGALWFSYPPLLRAHLLAEVRGLDTATLVELRQVTAHAYLTAGQPLSALEQLRDLTDPAPLRAVLRDTGLGVVLDGDGARLFDLLERCDPALATDPYLHLLRAVDALGKGEINTATAYLGLASAPPASGTALGSTIEQHPASHSAVPGVHPTRPEAPPTRSPTAGDNAASATRRDVAAATQTSTATAQSPATGTRTHVAGLGAPAAAHTGRPGRGDAGATRLLPIYGSSQPPEGRFTDAGSVCVPARWSALLRRAVEIEIAAATGRALGHLAVAATTEPTGNQDIDSYVAVQDATVLLVRGEVRSGEERLRRALALARHARLALRSTNRLAVASGVEGSLTGMRERAQRALDIASAHRLMDSTDALQAVVMTALAAHLQGDDQGCRYFAGVLADYGRRGAFGPGSHEHVVAQVLGFEGAPDRYRAAQSLRHSMSTLLHRSLPPFTIGLLVQSVWSLLRVPDGRAAQQLVAEARRAVGEHPAVTLCEAGVAAASHRARSVLASTAPLLAAGDRVNPLMAVLAWLLDATAHAELGNSLKAYESMASALRRAEPEHLIRPFLQVPGALELLDTFGGRFGHEDVFAARVRHHPAAVRGPATHPALTTTELTVLKQLPSGRTTQQIADDLGVSINTVKTHMRGIYGKLGTSSRTDALDQARRTGLL